MTDSRKHLKKSGESNNPEEIPAKQGFSVYYRGKTLLSRINPISQADRLVSEIKLREKTLYLCPSPLYGYGLESLLERLKKEKEASGSAILCVEADEKLFCLSNSTMPRILQEKNIAFLRAGNSKEVCAFVLKNWGQRVYRRVETIRLSGGWQLCSGLYAEIEAVLRKEIAVEWSNAMTLIRLGRLYARNLIRNLALLGGNESSFPDYGALPVLVLGAGPSLDPFLNELSLLWGGSIPAPEKRRFKIVCVDSCLTALNEREITPDLAIVLESQQWNLRAFIGLKDKGINAAMDLSSLPASTRILGGKKSFFATAWTSLGILRRLEKAGILPEAIAPMGSVGLYAVAIALRSGTGPVITSGIDFSYSLDACHARSTPVHRELEIRQSRFESAIPAGTAFRNGTFHEVSKTRQRVYSDPAMRNYRDLFKQEFSSNKRLLDIKGSGLPLGVKTISASEAFTILKGNIKSESELNPGEKIHRQRIIDFIHSEIERLKELKDILTGAASCEGELLEKLLDEEDYLWAHFPECAGAGGRRPPATDLNFLTRVRIEIEPFLKCWNISLTELLS